MNWIKEDWFKLGILILLLTLVSGIALYLHGKNKLAEQERLDRITKEAETKTAEEQAKREQQQAQLLEQQRANQTAATRKARITSQIIEFEEVLEGKIVPADINCGVLTTSNYILATSPRDSPNAWRDNQEATKEKCRSAFAALVFIRNKLIAELETQNLRRILTAYIDSVRALAMYALDGGYSAQVVDKHSTEFDTFRLEAREELLRLQRQYNVKPQYIR